MLKKLLYILIVAVLVTGCGETLKSSWSNFRAYYNTYYNAKKSFRAGLKKVEKQPLTIDPDHPVPVHHIPIQAGDSDFEEAIEKGTQVLQNFSDSKWVDDALLLIGKSYYYSHEFYQALQRFEVLQKSSSRAMQQSAIIWKGKTLLALERYNEGAQYLEAVLSSSFGGDSAPTKAEIQVLAGEHHAMLGNWDQASQWLSKAIADIENRRLLGRTLFLYGQVLEQSQRYSEAYYAFSTVSENFSGFEYAYWAAIKRADVARKEGNVNLAITIYEDLQRDDKNIQRRAELNLQIARALEMGGESEKALNYYKNLLKSDQRIPRDLQADVYYRLGKIYSDVFNNYPVAAAYFDSSSSAGQVKKSGSDEDAQTLANAFARYTGFRKTIQRSDSLLWLGSLPSSRLDSVIEQIRVQKRKELIERREAESENRLLNRNLQSEEEVTVSPIFGFLNHRNTELVNRSKAEFRLVWGNRPLVDNWRRMEAVQQSSVSGPSTEKAVAAARFEETAAILDLNIDEIPDTPEEKADLRLEKAEAQYQLGNLFFLTLHSPDSARIYFYRVIKAQTEKELQAKAIYSLYELHNSQNNVDSLRFWGAELMEKYPDSRYAQRINSKNSNLSSDQAAGSSKIVSAYRNIAVSQDSDKAARLRSLALANRSSDLAPLIFYQAIEEYIRQAKARDEMNKFVLSLLSPDTLQLEAASNFMNPDRYEAFDSVYWDSAGIAINEFQELFSNAPMGGRVAKLNEVLQKSTSEDQIATCKGLGIELEVKPSLSGFMSKVEYPANIEERTLSGKISYSFIVTPGGDIQSYQLISKRTSLGIEDALEATFDELRFISFEIENPPAKIRCEVDFPLVNM